MSFRLGIIGSGGIGEVHAEAAVKAGQTIAGFCDIELRKARRLAEKHPQSIATTSMDELLSLPDLKAVVIATPNHRHKDLAIKAIQAGKDVLLEKPMALNVAECDEIIAISKKSKQIVQVNFVTRQSPCARAVHDLVQAGRFGRIYHVKASYYRRRGIPGLGRWFTNKAESGGGVLIDLGVHLIDLVLHLTGRPKVTRVSGACTSTFGNPIPKYNFTEMWAGPPDINGIFDVEDAATALIRFDNGMTLELNATWAANLAEDVLPSGVVMLGDKGGCNFELWGKRINIATQQDGLISDVKPVLPAADPWPSAWKKQHELFAHAVETRTAPPSTIEHGREVQGVLAAVYQSSAEGREVELR